MELSLTVSIVTIEMEVPYLSIPRVDSRLRKLEILGVNAYQRFPLLGCLSCSFPIVNLGAEFKILLSDLIAMGPMCCNETFQQEVGTNSPSLFRCKCLGLFTQTVGTFSLITLICFCALSPRAIRALTR